MLAVDQRLAHLDNDERAFIAMRDELIRQYGIGHAVIQAGKLFGVYSTADEAFEVAIRTFGTRTPFFIRNIAAGQPPIEAPALVLGLIDSKIP
jgi:hypothetical protein